MNTITHVPLASLVCSEDNVRRSQEDIDDLVASIPNHGLLNPLTVVQSKKDTYVVVAGSRRLRALQQLEWAEGVPVHIVDGKDAIQISLTENISRKAMTMQDLVLALRNIMGDKGDIKFLMDKFGITLGRARQLARISAADESVINAYLDGDITLDQIEAFCCVPDNERQAEVFELLWAEDSDPHNRDPHDIRRAMGISTRAERDMLDIVGQGVYEDAGGTITQDLFGDSFTVDHPTILQDLYISAVKAKFEAMMKLADRDDIKLLTDPEELPENHWNLQEYPSRGDVPEEDKERYDELNDILSWDSDATREEKDAARKERGEIQLKRNFHFTPGGELGAYFDRGSFSFYWLVKPKKQAAPKTKDDGAPAEKPLSQKAIDQMEIMQRSRLCEALVGSNADIDQLLFIFARTLGGNYAFAWDTQGVSHINEEDERLFFADLKWCKETDLNDAWKAWCKWISDEKRTKLVQTLLGAVTINKGGTKLKSFLASFCDEPEFVSTEEFWELFRSKAQVCDIIAKFAPELAERFRNEKSCKAHDARRYAHHLCSGRGIDSYTCSDEERAAAEAWIPDELKL